MTTTEKDEPIRRKKPTKKQLEKLIEKIKEAWRPEK